MFGKLLKHEFKATARLFPLMYLGLALLLLTSCVSKYLDIEAVFGFSQTFSILGTVAMVLVTVVWIFMRFYKSMFSDEGYLTHTLPVKPGAVVMSKAFVSIVWYVLSFIVAIAAALFVAALFGAFDREFFAMITALYPNFKWSVFAAWVTAIAVIALIQSVYFIAQVYFCLALGNSGSFKHPVGMGILFYVVYYFINQTVTAFLMMFVPLGIRFDSDGIHLTTKRMMDQILNGMTTLNIGFELGIAAMIFSVIAAAALFYFTARIIDKRLLVQ